MDTMSSKQFWQCMFSPRLNKLYGNGPVERLYEPSSLEHIGDRVIQSLYFMWKIGLYTSPIIAGFLYRRGYFELEGCVTLTKFASIIGGIIAVSYVIRGIGRSTNPMYQRFITTLNAANANFTPTTKQQLANYDFEFYAYPTDFRYSDIPRDEIKARFYLNNPKGGQNLMQMITSLPCQILAYIAVHTFGIRLVYPGSIGVLQNILAANLLQGRSKLIEVNGGIRYKVETKDMNHVDIMFVDKRNNKGNGNTLVLCSEGNAGFYEIGIMGTPIAAGYSVLGWNHPGFGGSTGTPYPSQELNAMDAVIQFAINKLNFKVENIVLYGWSIGGFSSSWAAMNYPNVKAIVLDATFDDILPLAVANMPSWADSIVWLAIRQYINLNIFEQLCKYPGPVLFIRRSEDEVICTSNGEISTNRGNYLLLKMLKHRYPDLIGDEQRRVVIEYLSANTAVLQDETYNKYNVKENIKQPCFKDYLEEKSKTYPINVEDNLNNNQKTVLALFLARKYMKDYKSTHCTPLPVELFQIPSDSVGST